MAATVDHITVVTNDPEVPWGPGVLSVLPVTGTNCAVSVVLCADLEPALSIIHHARTHGCHARLTTSMASAVAYAREVASGARSWSDGP